MRNRFIAAIITAALVVPVAAQTPARLGGHPNFNGIWQALGTANWDLEAHTGKALDDFWGLGAIASVPPGKSYIKGGGTIPYLPAAAKQRDTNREYWPQSDNEAKCFMLGVPRYTYHNLPFQIMQNAGRGDAQLLMVYPFAAGHRVIHMTDKTEDPVESWMGKSTGAWDKDTLVVTTISQNENTMLDRAGNHHSADLKVTERFALIDPTHIRYEATLEDPKTYSKPWTIEMTLYKVIDQDAELLENKCVTFADKLMYSDLMGLKPQSKLIPGSPQTNVPKP